MSDFAARIAALPAEKRLLLELKLRAAGKETPRPGAEAVPREGHPFDLVAAEDRSKLPPDAVDAYPLSMMQEAMLYHMGLTPDYPVYHNVDSYQCVGSLDPAALERAVQAVVARHPVLRTSFDLVSYSQPLQVVHRSAYLPVRVEDLRELPGPGQEAVIDAYVESEKRRRFDLSQPPLLRFCVHLRGNGKVQFTLTEFHPILDGWSLQLTFLEILRKYATLLRGEPLPDEPPPAASFRDFIRMEREALASEASRSFWEEQLAGYTVASLPRWSAVPFAIEGRPIRSVFTAIGAEVLSGLQQLARTAKVPLKSVCLAVHLRVVSLLTGRDDVVTGQVTHGRPEGVGGDQARGLFLNTLPLRLRLGSGSWVDLARRVFAAELELVAHRHYPMPALQKRWSGARLFETALNFTNFHVLQGVGEVGAGLEIVGSRVLEENSFPLSVTLSLDPSSTFLQLVIMHHRSELESAQVDAIVGYYLRLLAAAARHPEGHHELCRSLSDAELHQQIVEWNAAAAPAASELLVHDLIAAQASRVPDAPAVIFAGESLSYRELDRQADRLAVRLLASGVGPEVRVGLYVHRSPAMVVGLLAILKAGGAYVPLDPDYPGERLHGLVADAGIRVVLTEERSADRFSGQPVALVLLDSSPAETVAVPAGPRRVAPDNLAYVIYTSGSTGLPKGVMVTHRNLVASTASRNAFYREPVERFLLLSSYAFDSSVAGIFGTLCQGGALVLPAPGAERDPQQIAKLIREARVSHLLALPSLYSLLLDQLEGEGGTRPALAAAIVAGEVCPADLPPRHRAILPGSSLFNEYGPTEGTVWSSVHDTGAPLRGGRIPIGRPIPGVRLYLFDPFGRPLATGVPGELWIGGPGVARGYLGRPGATAEKFLPDHLGGEPGARLYHTGDLARWLPDGTLEFLGRVDQQVKIRGVRIEPGEIEAELLRIAGVREAVVAIEGGNTPTGPRLVAYLVAAQPAPRAGELRRLLRQRLPGPMIPAAFVLLDELPRTPNGKVDRDGLPAAAVTAGLEEEYVPPEGELEQAVAAAWQDVLAVDRVSVTESFFDVGGHSLLLPRLLQRLASLPGKTLAMADIFSHPTVRSQAELLARPEGSPPPEGTARETLRKSGAGWQRRSGEKRRSVRSGDRSGGDEA